MLDKDKLDDDILMIEKGLKASEEVRQEALTKKSMWVQSVKEKDEELAKLGTTSEKGKEEIQKIEAMIEEKKQSLLSAIPFALLKQRGKIQ